MGYTKGPWIVREMDLFEGGAKGIDIVSVDGTLIADNQTYYPHAIEPDNAHLIASAPELLEALQGALSGFQCTQDISRYDAVHWCQKAIVAIRKATGAAE